MIRTLLLSALALGTTASAFAETERRGWWQVVGYTPDEYCSPGIREGQVCSSDRWDGYECKLGSQIWRCQYYAGAVRVRRVGNIPPYCGSYEYEGGACNTIGKRCSDGDEVLQCVR